VNLLQVHLLAGIRLIQIISGDSSMAKMEPTEEKTGQKEVLFRAESFLLDGYLKHPLQLNLQKQGLVRILGRASHAYRITEGFSADGLISFESGRTRASGSYSQHGRVTLATAVVNGLNVFDVVTADHIVAQQSTQLPEPGFEASLTFLGTRFENFRICGLPVQVELDLDLFGPRPDRHRSYFEDKNFLKRVEQQVSRLAELRDLPDVLRRQYDSQLSNIREFRYGMYERSRSSSSRSLKCSLVKSIEPIPIPGVTTIGNAIVIPDFGVVSLAEVEVGGTLIDILEVTHFSLTMIKIRMGSVGEGDLTIANTKLDGGVLMRGGGGDLEVSYVLSTESAAGAPESDSARPVHTAPASASAPTPPTSKEASSRPVFPWIVPSRDHVVQATKFDLEVSLRLTPAQDVQGTAALPVTDEVFEIDVHLLLGSESLWQQLIFSWSQLTIKPARFERITAPAYRGTAAEPDFRAIRVNFYWNHRWCGEGLKNIEILRNAGDLETNPIPKPSEPEWRQWLNVSSGECAPPDLLVRIQEKSNGTYHWSLVSPHADFRDIPSEKCEMTLKGGAQSYVKSHFEPLAGIALNALTMARLDGTCKQIYMVAPAIFKDVYWQLYHAARENPTVKLDTIQFVTDEPYIPWEIMRVEDEQRGPNIDGEILSVRHSVGRWLAEESCQIRSLIPLQSMAIFASDYSTVTEVESKLNWAEQEAEDLVGFYANKASPKATRYKLISREVLSFLETGKAQILHFSCHGRMDQQSPNLSSLMLEDDLTNFTPPVVIGQSIQRGIGREHPLVFLNACQVGGTGAELSFVTGWPQAFLTMGASAVIAPLWSVGDDSARIIAEEFYKVVISNSPISLGAALQNIRKQFRGNGKMTYLAYLLYGDPNTMISVV
jgi:hypothetical protein